MTNTVLQEISLPSVVAWEWQSSYAPNFPGIYRHQIVWLRGTSTLRYGTAAPGQRWVTTRIVRPERLGFDGSLASAREVAQAFIDRSLITTNKEGR